MENIPVGATHYDHEIKKYINLSDDKFQVWYDEYGWVDTHIIFLDIERCTALPQDN